MTAKEWREKWLAEHGTTQERLRQAEARPDVSEPEDLENGDLDELDPLDEIRNDLDEIKRGLVGIVLLLLVIGGLALARLYHFL